MNLFLAESGGVWKAYFKPNDFYGAKILQSFYYADSFTENAIIPNCKEFLLDSGAFTFMSKKPKADWDRYIKDYAGFIRRNNVRNFFELDIDSIVGYEKVKEYRNRLEDLAGAQCIPVWHKSRGKDEFLRMCEDYPYIAIGGIVTKEISKEQYPFFSWFISEAHKKSARYMGLVLQIWRE